MVARAPRGHRDCLEETRWFWHGEPGFAAVARSPWKLDLASHVGGMYLLVGLVQYDGGGSCEVELDRTRPSWGWRVDMTERRIVGHHAQEWDGQMQPLDRISTPVLVMYHESSQSDLI